MQQTLPFSEIGQGPPMALFHGLGGDRKQWLDLLPQPLPFRTLLPDLPGHGEADWLPASGCSFTSFAEVAHQWLSTCLGTEPVILGGISMGAGIALRLALLAPERVRTLILVRPAWLDQPLPDNLQVLYRLGKVWSTHTTDQTRRWLEQDSAYQTLLAQNPACARSIMGQLARPDFALAAQTLVAMAADSLIPEPLILLQLSIPTLVIGSDHDPLHPLAMARKLANWLPAADFQQVASRYNQPDAHRQQLQQQLTRFLGLLDP